MSELEITKIHSEIPVGSFDCGNPSINASISESYYPTLLQHAYAFMVSCNNIILGYYMIKFLNIKLTTCPEEIADYCSSLCDDCFSLHIKYVAVNSIYQRNGIGHNILNYIIKSTFELSRLWPVRLITLDALKEKYSWYQELGFIAFNEADLEDDSPTLFMYMDCLLNPDSVNSYSETI